MTTPISPDHRPEAGADSIAPTIAAIAGGDFSRSRLAVLSDLDRSRSSLLRKHWLEVPTTERHALLLALDELAQESLDFNFNRVFRVALEDPDPVIRQLAIRSLWEDQGSDLSEVFLRMLRDDQSDDVRAAAADALSAFVDALVEGTRLPIDRNQLIELFSEIVQNANESPIVRRRALGAIAAFDDDANILALIRTALDDDDQTVVAGAIYAMGRTARASWIPDLLEFMQSEDAELRFEAARAAGAIGERDAVPELAHLVHDQDAEVRAAALEALGAIGGPAAVRILRDAEQDDEFENTNDVDDALDAALLTVDPLDGLN